MSTLSQNSIFLCQGHFHRLNRCLLSSTWNLTYMKIHLKGSCKTGTGWIWMVTHRFVFVVPLFSDICGLILFVIKISLELNHYPNKKSMTIRLDLDKEECSAKSHPLPWKTIQRDFYLRQQKSAKSTWLMNEALWRKSLKQMPLLLFRRQ